MNVPRNIFLVGMMGAGKSTVGRHLAKSLGKEFVDCDHELEEHTGASISLIFEIEGEDGFRKREQKMLEELSARENIVLATGGGVVNAPENRSRLRERGYTVFLDAPLDLLMERTSRDRNRPLLDTDNREASLKALLETRNPLYLDVADLVVKTDRRSPRSVARDIAKQITEDSLG